MDLSTYIMAKKYTDEHGGGGGGGYSAGTGIDITGSTISVDADSAPTKNSQKPVTSGGTKSAIDASQNASLQMLSDTVGWSGKNLFPLTLNSIKALNTNGTWSGNAYTLNGVTYTVSTNSDRYVNEIDVDTNGASSSADGALILWGNATNRFNGMILNGCPAGGSAQSYTLLMYDSTSDVTLRDVGSGVTITHANGDICRINITVKSGQNISHKKFYPMLRKASISDSTFEPYHASVDIVKANTSALAPVENGSTVLQAYDFMSHFMHDGEWFTSNSITQNGTITEGSNCKKGTLSESLFDKGYIRNTDDLNNIKTSGMYYIATSPSNAPESIGYCVLLVKANKVINPNFVEQVIFDAEAIYTREFSGSPANWGNWVKFTGTVIS